MDLGRLPNVTQDETSKRNGFDLGECLVLHNIIFILPYFPQYLKPQEKRMRYDPQATIETILIWKRNYKTISSTLTYLFLRVVLM